MKRLSFFPCYLILIITVSSCEETNPENTDPLSGLWVNVSATETATVNVYLSYHFKANNQFEALLSIVDENANEVLGYRYRGLGTYALQDETLSIAYTQIYVNDDSRQGYSALEDLLLTDGTSEDILTIAFSEGDTTLTVYYGACGPNESFIGQQTFRKAELPF
ncbi:MAG: hypothetical protein Roseis2KO_00490 [Roseivirga sp.]